MENNEGWRSEVKNCSGFRTDKKKTKEDRVWGEGTVLCRIGITGGKMLRMEVLDESEKIEDRGHR
jgi:hypothetical protein